VLSRQEVERLLEAPRSLKHRALLAMVYGSGLRVSEVVRVRIGDVDRGRMMLKVEQGKGHKDRYPITIAACPELVEAAPSNCILFRMPLVRVDTPCPAY
jgi:site-specific recombinase XerD